MLRRTTPSPVVAARVRELMRAHTGMDEVVAPAQGIPVSRWQRLAGRIPVRLDAGRPAAIGVGLAVVAAAIATGVWLLAQRPRAVPLPASTPAIAGAASPVGSRLAATTGGSSPAAQLVVVDVAGKVHRPGLYRLPAGARVDDAVRRAGGALAGVDLTSLNLAARVVDGQQIVVGAVGAPASPDAAAGAGAAQVNLNAASLEQLESLPGVGPVLAQHILDWRAQHGGFASVDQLDEVPGIGDVKFAALRSLVSV